MLLEKARTCLERMKSQTSHNGCGQSQPDASQRARLFDVSSILHIQISPLARAVAMSLFQADLRHTDAARGHLLPLSVSKASLNYAELAQALFVQCRFYGIVWTAANRAGDRFLADL